MATQTNNLLILEHAAGVPTGTTRTLTAADQFTLSNYAEFHFGHTTNPIDFDGGLTVAASKSILGEGALTVRGSSADLTLDTVTSGDVIVQPAGDAYVKLAGDTTGEFFQVQNASTTAVLKMMGDGSGIIGLAGQTLTAQGSLTVAQTLTVTGDLTVDGTTFTVNSTTLTVDDNLIVANSGPGASRDAGYLIERWQDEVDDGTGDLSADTAKESGTAASAGATTIVLQASNAHQEFDDHYNNWYVKITGGTGANQVRKITDYTGSTLTATVSGWSTQPDNTSTYNLLDRPFMGVVYDESADEWVFAATASDPGAAAVVITDYVNVHVGGLVADDISSFAGAVTFDSSVNFATAGEVLVSAGNFQLNDSIVASWGTSDDMIIVHDGTDNIIDSVLATAKLKLRLGTDTTATGLYVENDSASSLFQVLGDGQADFAGNVDANLGLDVSGAALTVDNQAITQTTGGQVTFAGNLDANGGVDITNGPLTIVAQAITQTTSGQVTFAGNLDANGGLDVAGVTTMVGTLTVGVDDTGHDVKFFGATSGSYMLWDESADDLVLAGAGLNLGGGTSVTSIDTDLTAVSGADDSLASAKAIKAYVDATVSGGDLDFTVAGGAAQNITLDSEVMSFTNGTGISMSGSGNDVTVAFATTAAPASWALDTAVLSLDGTDSTNLTMTANDGGAKVMTISAQNGGAGTGALSIVAKSSIDISDDATANFVNVGTGAAAKTVFVGSTNTTSASTFQAGSGAMTFTAGGIFDVNATGAVTMDGTTLSLDGTDSTNLTMTANDGGAKVLTIQALNGGAGAGNLTLVGKTNILIGDNAGSTIVNVGTGAAAKTVTVGSTNTTSATTFQAGSGAMTFTAGDIFDVNATGAVTIDGPGVSIDGTDHSNLTVTGSAKNLTVAAAGGGAQVLALNSAGTGANAIDINATAGGIDMDAAGAITMNSAGASNLSVTGANLNVNTVTSGDVVITAAGDLIARGTGQGFFGDGVGSWDFNGSGAVSETDMTTFSLTPSSTVDIDAGGALTIDSGSTITIGGDSVNQAINLATAGTRTLSVGSATATMAVTSGGGQSSWTVMDNDFEAFKFTVASQDFIVLDSSNLKEQVQVPAFLNWLGGAGVALDSGAVVTANHAVTLGTDGKVIHSDADTDAGSRVLGWTFDTTAGADEGVRVATEGSITMEFDGTALDTGTPANDVSKPVYLSVGPGKVSLDVPSGPGDSIVRVGWLQAIVSTTKGIVIVDKRFIGKIAA